MLPKANPAMISGIMIVVMRNPRVRMRSMYSRCAISQTLRMETAPILGIEVAPRRFSEFGDGEFAIGLHRRRLLDLLDKDLFERRFRHFKASDASVADRVGKERLSVVREGCGGTQFDLGLTRIPLDAFDARMLEESVIAFEADMDSIAGVAGLDLAHRAGEHEVATVNEGDGIAELFHLVHPVGRK